MKLAKFAALGLIFLTAAGAAAYLTLIFLIKTEDTVVVPDLVGQDVVTALELLTDLHLNTKVTGSEYNRQFPKNFVAFQDPESGSEIKKDRDVRIILSKGAETISMPDLVALSERQARAIMEENGIFQRNLSQAYVEGIPKDHVILQSPPAGTSISRGAPVDLLASLGPRPIDFQMPDLAGVSLDQALLEIERTHLVLGSIESRVEKNLPRNSVIGQEPPAGYRISQRSPINLIVNRPPGREAVGRHLKPMYGSLLQHRIENGYLRKRIRVDLHNNDTTTNIFDDYIKPGEELWVLVPRETDATAFVYEDDRLVGTHHYDAW